MKWVAFYSYTGSELKQVIEKLKHVPDIIVTNNPEPVDAFSAYNVHSVPYRPTIADYDTIFDQLQGTPVEDIVITLHGWNRIVPDVLCSYYIIYNVHPGDVIKYPVLRGADPQRKAIELQLPDTCVIIHEVTPVLDGGPIIRKSTSVSIGNRNELELTNVLRVLSVDLWVDLLTGLLEG